MMLISWATRIAEPPKTGLEFWKTLFLVYLDLDFRALENGFLFLNKIVTGFVVWIRLIADSVEFYVFWLSFECFGDGLLFEHAIALI
ncbi:hypothetical protein CUMW_237710 [Citrus unshiu]|nr:hypothetical protein CUMW_237710 [Citrus unshiu]